MHRHIFTIWFIATTLFACKSDRNRNAQSNGSIDLLKYGIADRIYPPQNVKITSMNSDHITGVTISADSSLEAQALMSISYTKDFNKLVQDRKQEIITNPFFVKIVEENDEGFLFEKEISPTVKSYDFRIIKLIGDNDLTYQCGVNREYTEPEAKKIMAWVLSRDKK